MSFFDEIKTEIQTEQNQKSNLAEQASAAQASQAATLASRIDVDA